MTDLERLKAWIQTYPQAEKITGMQVDYTDQLPGCFGVFPAGLVEIDRAPNLIGEVTVTNQYNWALYIVFAKAPGDDVGAAVNADWIMDFQKWVQEQSVTHRAPTFGNIDQDTEIMSAQNGALYDAEAEGLGMYMIALQATFKTLYDEL